MSEEFSFEAGMQELETLTQQLERGEMTLNDSFKAYERAIEIKKRLEALLEEGEEKIRILTENGEEETRAEDIR